MFFRSVGKTPVLAGHREAEDIVVRGEQSLPQTVCVQHWKPEVARDFRLVHGLTESGDRRQLQTTRPGLIA